MKSTTARSHRSHYVSRFVLRAFANDDDQIWFTRTGGEWKEPLRVGTVNVFVEKDLYAVVDENGGKSDLNERILAKKEGVWAGALNRIKEMAAKDLEAYITEEDAQLAVEYYLHAGFRTPEHLHWVMHSGEHNPREVIRKVFKPGRRLLEADFHTLEKNIRATLGSGQADLIKGRIEQFKHRLGLGIYKLESGVEGFIIGSRGAVQLEQLMYFLPVAPDMALFCTNRSDCLVVTRQSEEGDETRRKMNVAMWKNSKWVAAASSELLKAVEKQATAGTSQSHP